jgi:excisionase family DNA binding protein
MTDKGEKDSYTKKKLIEELYTVKSLAEELQVRPETIYRYFRSGRLHGAKIGRFLRFSPDNVKKFLNGEQ